MKYIFIAVAAMILALWLCGCGTMHKVFDKHKEKVDSTSVSQILTDSVTKSDSFAVRKSQTDADGEIVIDFGDSGISDPGIYVYPNTPSAYLEITPAGIKTNKPIKSVTIKGKFSSKTLDSIGGKQEVKVHTEIKDSTHLIKQVKEVTKEVKKTKLFPGWIWWLLLLIVGYVIYRNRDKIKSFILPIIP